MNKQQKPGQRRILLWTTLSVIGGCVLACLALVLFVPSAPTTPTPERGEAAASVPATGAPAAAAPTATAYQPTIAPSATPPPTATTFVITPEPSATPGGIVAPPCVPPNERIRAEVVSVTDGDTIRVRFAGQEWKVRYIGMDTPDSTTQHEPFGEEASAFNAVMVAGQTVTLVKDVSETDRYGRLLRYVFVGDLFVNAELVRQGYATVATYPPDVACIDYFRRLEGEARERVAGLWAGGALPVAQPTAPPVVAPTAVPASGAAWCDCGGPDLNCGNFASHANAQGCYDYCRGQGYGDVFNLDRDGNGQACESLP